MDNHRTHCDECKYLEIRDVKAETPQFSGNYEQTGKRYHCILHDKWYPINTSKELVGHSFCVQGERI